MVFAQKISDLLLYHKEDTKISSDGVKLILPSDSPPPLARHCFFPPMPVEIQIQLKAAYSRQFPDSMIQIYKLANGMSLGTQGTVLCVGRETCFT